MCGKLTYLSHYGSFTVQMTNILLYCQGIFKYVPVMHKYIIAFLFIIFINILNI